MPYLSAIIVFAAAAIATFPHAGYARPGIVPGTEAKGQSPVRVSTSSHKLLSSTIDSGFSGVTAQPYALPTIDSNVVKCPKATCTIVINVTLEVGSSSTPGNQWAACAVVDGAMTPNGCPYNGELLSDDSYLTGTARQTFPVGHGSHAVSFELFVGSAPATAGIYDVDYEVLTP